LLELGATLEVAWASTEAVGVVTTASAVEVTVKESK
jgi:hypothetical protein